jgi:imidazolonepropionase
MTLPWVFSGMPMQAMKTPWRIKKDSTWIYSMKGKLRLLGPFKQAVTMDGLGVKGALPEDTFPVISNAGILISDGMIEAIGDFRELQSLNATIEPVEGSYTVMPGMIDVHTHICWAGIRAKDYAMRLSGKTYLEIAQQGGGIWNTVTATRSAGIEELTQITVARAQRLLNQGTTTLEIKSGYGLDVPSEIKMLTCIKEANKQGGADLISTCLAHIKPKDFDGSALQYLELLVAELLPVVKEKKLADRVDIYVDVEAFNRDDARYFLTEAKEMGFELTVHADQFTPGGVSLAVELGALSADHLEASTEKDIKLIANSHVIPVVLPGASIGLGSEFAPARRLLDAGASLVIASDWNPGSAPMGNLLMQASVLGVYEKLTMAETLSAITFRAARALGLTDRGVLAPGMLADLVAFPCSDYREILYNQGGMMPGIVWKNGRKVTSD